VFAFCSTLSVSGKLKVLPEQPELPVIDVKEDNEKRLGYMSEAVTSPAGDSDEGDIDEDSDEDFGAEDVEVRIPFRMFGCISSENLGLQSTFPHP
jgi:hypothetical protein